MGYFMYKFGGHTEGSLERFGMDESGAAAA